MQLEPEELCRAPAAPCLGEASQSPPLQLSITLPKGQALGCVLAVGRGSAATLAVLGQAGKGHSSPQNHAGGKPRAPRPCHPAPAAGGGCPKATIPPGAAQLPRGRAQGLTGRSEVG